MVLFSVGLKRLKLPHALVSVATWLELTRVNFRLIVIFYQSGISWVTPIDVVPSFTLLRLDFSEQQAGIADHL